LIPNSPLRGLSLSSSFIALSTAFDGRLNLHHQLSALFGIPSLGAPSQSFGDGAMLDDELLSGFLQFLLMGAGHNFSCDSIRRHYTCLTRWTAAAKPSAAQASSGHGVIRL
jgi:hypothetical protein